MSTAAAIAAAAILSGLGLSDAHGCGPSELCDPPALGDIGGGSSGNGGSVNASCGAVLGVTTNLERVTYTFAASAVATSTDPTVTPVGTAVVCYIKNAATGAVYGTARGGLPGSTAAAVGTATLPRGAGIVVCVDSSAVFSDGSTARDADC